MPLSGSDSQVRLAAKLNVAGGKGCLHTGEMPERVALAALTLQIVRDALGSGAPIKHVRKLFEVAVAAVDALPASQYADFEGTLHRLADEIGVPRPNASRPNDRIRIAELRTVTPAIQVQHVLRCVDADVAVVQVRQDTVDIWAVASSPAHPFASAAALYYEIDATLRWGFDEGTIGQFLLTPAVP